MRSSFYSDALLWVGILVVGTVTYRFIPSQLLALRQITDIQDEETAPGLASKQTERALDLNSLAVLTKSSNANLRDTAARVLLDRLLDSDGAWKLLLGDLASRDAQKRGKALMLIDLLKSDGSSMITHPRIFEKAFLSALVVCLANLLPDFEATERERRYPTDGEKLALKITSVLLQSPQVGLVSDLIDAGLIESWLQHHPFSDRRDSDRKKFEVVQDLIVDDDREIWQSPHLKNILLSLIDSSPGNAGLVAAGLWSPKREVESERPEQLRKLDDTEEEMALRRRRREAIVVGEEVLQQGEEIHDLAAEHILSRLRGGLEERQPADVGMGLRLQRWMRRSLPLR